MYVCNIFLSFPLHAFIFGCRLFPIAPNNSRLLAEDVVLAGFKVPAEVSGYC